MDFDYAAARNAGYSDEDILNVLQSHGQTNLDFDAAKKDGYSATDILDTIISRTKPKPVEKPQETPLLGRAGDIGISALKGAIGVPESALGLADIVTGGYAGKGAEALGFRPKEARETLNEMYSPAQKAANQRVAEAKGFLPTVGAMVSNPSTLVQTGLESLPSMGAGGVVGRGALAAAPRIGEMLAGAIGEGVVGAGQSAEQIRQQTPGGNLSLGQAGAALASGIGDTAFAAVGGRIAHKLGISDIDTALVHGGAVETSSKGVARRMLEGGISEGVFEELPQSIQEQIWQNAAMDKPLLDGVPEQAAQGMLAGGLFGGVAGGALHGKPHAATPEATPTASPLLIGNTPDPFLSFPDGSVGRKSDAEAFINALPEHERLAARSRLFGMQEQSVTPTDVLQAQTVDDAIAVANKAIEQGTPEFQAQRNSDIDAAWLQHLTEAATQRQAEFTAAEDARRAAETQPLLNQVADQNVEQANAVTDAQGFDQPPVTAMQLAMQQAQDQRAQRNTGIQQRVAIESQPQGDINGKQIGGETSAIESTQPQTPNQQYAIQAQQRTQAQIDASIERAKSVLTAADVTGNERMAALRSIRNGDNTIEDLIDAHPPKPQEVANVDTSANNDGGIRNVGRGSDNNAPRNGPSDGGRSGPTGYVSGNEQGTAGLASGESAANLSSASNAANEQSPLAQVSGKQIDKEWTEFASGSGTLGIGRDQMPQVKAEHRGALTQFLAARGITHETTEVPAGDLKPTQREYSTEKVQKARAYEGGDRSILVSSDNHILDGHHQWLAKLDAGEPVKIIRLDAPIRELLSQVHDFPSSEIARGITSEGVNHATQEINQQSRVQGERGQGNSSGQANETSSSNSIQRPTGSAEAARPTKSQEEVARLRAARDERIAAQREKPKTEQQLATEAKYARQEAEIAKAKENAAARSAEKAAPSGKVVERYLGQYGKGMSENNAKVEAAQRNKKADGITWAIEPNEDLGYDRYEVVGRKQAPLKSESQTSGGMAVAAVNKAIVNLKAKWLGFTKVNTVQSIEDLPADIQDRAQADSGTEGIYDPQTKSVYLIADNIATPERAAWVAAHEVSHAGLRMLHDKSINEALNIAGANKFIKELAAAIQKDRGDVSANTSIEEAIAELSAATESSDFAALEDRYGVKVPATSRNGVIGAIARVYDAVKRFLALVSGRPVASVPDSEVRALVGEQQAVVQAYDENSTKQGEGNGQAGFWRGLGRLRSDGRGLANSDIASAYSAKDRKGTREAISIYRTNAEAGEEAVEWGGSAAGFKGYSTVAKWHDDTFYMYVIPNELSSNFTTEDIRDTNKLLDSSIVTLSLKKENGRWDLGVADPEKDSAALAALDRKGRVEDLQEFSGSHQYTRVDLSGGVGIRPLLIELVRRFGLNQGYAPHVFVSSRDTGANRTRERVFTPEQIEAKFSKAPLQSRAPAAQPEEVVPKWAEGFNEAQKAALRKSGAIYTEKTMKQKIAELKEGALKKLQYGILDQFAPIKDQLGKIPYVLARMAKNADGTLEALMHYGRPYVDADGGMHVDTTKKGFIETMQALNGEHDRFFSWLAGRRAEQLKKEGRENLFTNDDISALSTLNQGTMKDGTSREAAYLRAQKDVAELNKSVLDIAESAGLIDPESRKVWASDFYVPFYRLMEEGVTGPSIKSGLVNQKSIKQLKGGTNNLGDLTQNMLMNWSTLLTASAKNRAAKATLEAAKQIGVATEADEATIRQMGKAASTKAVSYMDNGVNRWHVVEDEHLLAAISALEFSGYNNQAMKVMSKFKNYLTAAVTTMPLFKVRNLIRDSVSTIAVSDSGYNPFMNVKNGFSLLHNKDFKAQMVAGGGAYRFGTLMEGNRGEHVKNLIDAGVKDDTILNTHQKMQAFLQKLWDGYQEVGDLSENVNRAALYNKLRSEGMSHLEASFEARDLMDFGLSGAWAGVRALNQILPFFNARLQGLYKLGRGYNDDPRRMGYVVGAVALASIALLAAYKDDDDFKKRSDSDRNNYWWFKVGDTAFRIPKPFEIGALGTAIEHLTALAIDPENTNAKRFANQLGDLVNGQLAMNPIPQVFRPLIDIYANKDSFTGRPIENMAMQRLKPEDRYTYNTSELARLLSKSGAIVDPVSLVSGTGVKQLSPVQIDALIKGYFSGVGTLATAAVDGLLHHSVIDRGEALPTTIKTFAGSFAESLPTNSSRYVDMLYSTAQDIEQSYASYRNAIKSSDIDKARQIMKDEGQQIAKYHLVESLKKNESKINQQIQRVMNSHDLSGEQKAETIRRLKVEQDKIARVFAIRG